MKRYINSVCIEATTPNGKTKTYTLIEATIPDGKAKTYAFYNFMLKKPEPVKTPKFTTHNLGSIKGTMRRTEIYGDEEVK